MASRKLEYDSSLGGYVELGNHVSTYRYAANSVKEIKTLLASIKQPNAGSKLIFQTLPKHMRRRAMSHHPKRLPRKYRSAHIAQMAKAGKPPKQTRRPSRKYRRRPKHLLREYIRRQMKNKWLETHVWHARRFHMINRWGYRLPYASCEKTYRACYRASAEHCLLQDISFHACIQLRGALDILRQGMIAITDERESSRMTATTYVSGVREGRVELFRINQKPNGALGSATFMWRPDSSYENKATTIAKHTLWLWLHPAGYPAVLEELLKTFQLSATKTVKVELHPEEMITEPPSMGLRLKKPQRLQFMTRTMAYQRIKQYGSLVNEVELSELRDTMNRFRLTGRLAHRVLIQAFKVQNCRIDIENSIEKQHWLEKIHQKNSSLQENHNVQADFWMQASYLASPDELLSNMILGLNIQDPRINRPDIRSKAPIISMENHLSASNHLQLLVDMSPALPHSALWDLELTKRISDDMLSTQAYCDLRAKHAMALGIGCPFEKAMQPLPVILVQRPGSQSERYKRLGYGCGWDVIAPAGYGMTIWLSLIMWGARPGGLREFDSVAREMGKEQHLPDTIAGLQIAAERETELRDKYFRLPPNKRCNYNKLAIVSPFRAPWRQLVRDWLPSNELSDKAATCFHVLRHNEHLTALSSCFRRGGVNFPKSFSLQSLVQVEVILKSRGNLKDFSLICLPTSGDFKRNLRCIKNHDHRPIHTEPLRCDRYAKTRKLLRQEHKRVLKRMRARRVRAKRKLQETSQHRVHIAPANTHELVVTQRSKIAELWLPFSNCSASQSVRKQCSREVFGYVTSGAFSYTEARPSGIGYVTVEGMRAFLTRCAYARLKQPMCLVRGPTTRHYRFATMKLSPLE